MATLYSDELAEINRKSHKVFLKRGIYPFLGSKVKRGENVPTDGIDGFQIFSLYPKIFDDK
jgi:hypothetical protein